MVQESAEDIVNRMNAAMSLDEYDDDENDHGYAEDEAEEDDNNNNNTSNDIFRPISADILRKYEYTSSQIVFNELIEPRVKVLMEIVHENELNAILAFEFEYDSNHENVANNITIPPEFAEADENNECLMFWYALSIVGATSSPVMQTCAEMMRNFNGRIHASSLDGIVAAFSKRRQKKLKTIKKSILVNVEKLTRSISLICDDRSIPCCLCVRGSRKAILVHGDLNSKYNPAIQLTRCAVQSKDERTLKTIMSQTGVSDEDPSMRYLRSLLNADGSINE